MRGPPARRHAAGVSAAQELRRLGGVATRQQLLRGCTPRELTQATTTGEVVRVSRGRYALPVTDAARRAAHAVSGVLCLTSAALAHGWAVKTPPSLPQVALPRNRNPSVDLSAVEVKRLRLHADDVADGVTTQDRTLVDCLRMLPFDHALAIADSALREGFSHRRLVALARDARGPGAPRMRILADLATADSANPFESVLRSIALTVPGLTARPQVTLHGPDESVVGGGAVLGRPDLVDEQLRIVLEADSFEWHGSRSALRSDARRYNTFAVNGWLVLRFSWEDVMFEPEVVRATLVAAVAERTDRRCPGCGDAA